MKILFKTLILIVITSGQLQAQVHEIYKKSFDAEAIDLVSLDLNSSYVTIESSSDNKIHFDYNIEFENYSKKEKESFLNQIEVSSQIINNKLEFKTASGKALGELVYSIESLYGIAFEGDNIVFNKNSNREFRKSKQYFLSINNSSRAQSLKEYLKNIRALDEKGGKKKVNQKNIKIVRTKFTVRIPKHLNLRIIAIHSNLEFKDDCESKITVNARNTSLKFKNLTHALNNFDIVNGNFRANAINGGYFILNHVDKVLISEIKNLKIDSEFTECSFGEIGANIEINDFNSKFWLYNYSKDFKNFKMNTEYSEINLFYPENTNYFLETFGHDTIHYMNNITTEIPPSKKNKSSKMLVLGDSTKVDANKIEIKSVHGIIRFGDDFIDFKP